MILILYIKALNLNNLGKNRNYFIKKVITIILFFSLNCQLSKWAEGSGKLVLYNDPFVVKHKNNYTTLRNIHNQEKTKLKNLNKLSLIDDKYDDWQSTIVQWYNKWVTEGYSTYLKHLYLYGESYLKFKEFIKEIMGNLITF